MEFLSFPKHSTLLGLHFHPFPTSATAFTAGVRLGLNQTPHPAPQTNVQGAENPPSEHLQCLFSRLLLIPWPPAANRRGQDLACHVSPRGSRARAALDLCRRYLNPTGTSCRGTYAEHIFHLPSRLSQEPKELGHFALTQSCSISDSDIPWLGRSAFPAHGRWEPCPWAQLQIPSLGGVNWHWCAALHTRTG